MIESIRIAPPAPISPIVGSRGRSPALPAIAFALLAMLALPQPAGAQQPIPLDEQEFLARFQRSDPRFQVLAARIDESRAEVTDARVLPNPSLAFDREEVFPAGGSLPENFVRLAIPLNLSGRRSLRIRAAEAGVTASRAETSLDATLLVLDALDMYYDAAYARLRVEALRQGRTDLGRLVDVVRSRRSAGDVSGYDLDRLELELGAYDDSIAGADTELAAGRRRLAALVGDPDRLFDASTTLDLPDVPGDLARRSGAAAEKRGDVRAARLRAEESGHQLAAARRTWVPGFVVTGGFKTTDLGDETARGYAVGLAMELPLFDRGQADQARSSARQRQWQGQARAMERAAAVAIASAAEGLARQVAQARRHEETQVNRIADLVRRATTAYREGERPIFELLDAYRVARDVRLRQLELRRDARKAAIALARALGQR
jgi:outer membrane protein, heavy metal efflux system